MRHSKRKGMDLLLYTLSFLLLWEWLRPLEQITNTGYMRIFIIFTALSLLLNFIRLPFVFSLLIKGASILYCLHQIFFEGTFMEFSWMSSFMKDITQNVTIIFSGQWDQLSNLFRSLLFFIMIWLLTYLIHYWIYSKSQITIFFIMTVIYITVLDTFTAYDAANAIVRVVITGFTLLGLLTFRRLIEQEYLLHEKMRLKTWVIPLLLLISFSAVLGFFLPKQESQWPDPVPYLKSFGKGTEVSSSETRRVGYDTDDSSLGGPFIGNDDIVFRAEVSDRHYWRVETKDVYTGKGWIFSQNKEDIHFTQEQPLPFPDQFNRRDGADKSATVYFHDQDSFIVYPQYAKMIIGPLDARYQMDPATEKITAFVGEEIISLNKYSYQYEIPIYNVSTLSKVSTAGSIDQVWMERYTQLPEKLPQRVKDLALQITLGQKNWFDKVKAIERYFDRSEYTYDQQNVAIPKEQDDYVDQFLFETKKGYCDNFSSSMVVLLRSIGVPARWVKGFTEGINKTTGSTERRVFEITNNNAHSWVEVYFPQTGWVPFEPTKGFTNSAQFNYDTYKNEQQLEQKQEHNPDQQPITKTEPKSSIDDKKTNNHDQNFMDWLNSKRTSINWKIIIFSIAIVSTIAGWLFKVRNKWLPYLLIYIYSKWKKQFDLEQSYPILLKQLNRYGIKRKGSQTLRDYANYIDSFFSTTEMGRITSMYERVLYRSSKEGVELDDARQLWENLIKKTVS